MHGCRAWLPSGKQVHEPYLQESSLIALLQARLLASK